MHRVVRINQSVSGYSVIRLPTLSEQKNVWELTSYTLKFILHTSQIHSIKQLQHKIDYHLSLTLWAMTVVLHLLEVVDSVNSYCSMFYITSLFVFLGLRLQPIIFNTTIIIIYILYFLFEVQCLQSNILYLLLQFLDSNQ